MQTHRCGHFRLEVEEIYVPGAPVLLRVPIRRCVLAEGMIALIAQTEKGVEAARKLSIQHSSGANASLPAPVRAAFGPDLEAIHPTECTRQRCQESCSPGFKMLAAQFGFDAEASAEDASGCTDVDEVNAPH